MGLFRYIVQGFGWEIGSQAAREGIDALREDLDAEPAHPMRATAVADPREHAKLERRRRRDIEAQLAVLKREAKKRG